VQVPGTRWAKYCSQWLAVRPTSRVPSLIWAILGWDGFLDDFVEHWPTHEPNTYVDFIRDAGPTRIGWPTEFRLCERWTSSAKSVFQFGVQGQVAKSTHAGIPWLWHIRRHLGDRVHFWPFDGWAIPAGKSVIAEVYPSILRNRYPRDDRSPDEQDAYAVARWLRETCENGFLGEVPRPAADGGGEAGSGAGGVDTGGHVNVSDAQRCWVEVPPPRQTPRMTGPPAFSTDATDGRRTG